MYVKEELPGGRYVPSNQNVTNSYVTHFCQAVYRTGWIVLVFLQIILRNSLLKRGPLMR